jgi:hypothetical protein
MVRLFGLFRVGSQQTVSFDAHDVRSGSLAEIRRRIWDVRFTPVSRRSRPRHPCLLSANSGHPQALTRWPRALRMQIRSSTLASSGASPFLNTPLIQATCFRRLSCFFELVPPSRGRTLVTHFARIHEGNHTIARQTRSSSVHAFAQTRIIQCISRAKALVVVPA